jgi:predicted SAM-dependent methyltransferase
MKNALARIGISLGAIGLFLLIRGDVSVWAWNSAKDYTIKSARRMRSAAIIDAYVKASSVRRLQIGAGELNMSGFLNTDIEPSEGQAFLDATQPFPLPDHSFRLVFSEQVIEHVTYEQGVGMMRESFRVLEHGGKARVVTPNLLRFAELLQSDNQDYIRAKLDFHFWKPTADDNCWIVNMEMRSWGHQFIYTPKMLRAVFESVGFTNIRQYEAGESEDPDLRGLEMRSRFERSDLRAMNQYDSMAFEGTRP